MGKPTHYRFPVFGEEISISSREEQSGWTILKKANDVNTSIYRQTNRVIGREKDQPKKVY